LYDRTLHILCTNPKAFVLILVFVVPIVSGNTIFMCLDDHGERSQRYAGNPLEGSIPMVCQVKADAAVPVSDVFTLNFEEAVVGIIDV
jgi:hypothetical protein